MNLGKKIITLLAAFFSLSFLFSSEYPKSLSKEALISIVTINYSKKSYKTIFSKVSLRIYDKRNNFDELIDFAYFKNFNDPFFLINFYFQNPRAYIVSSPFTQSIIQEKDAEITDIVLNLSYGEIIYIYDFLKNLHDNLKNYSYDYDIQKNNSYTHIAKILNDASASTNNLSSKYSFYDYSRKLSLVFKNIDKTILTQVFSTKQIETSHNSDLYKFSLPKVSKTKIILFSFAVFIIILFTLLPNISYFQKKSYINSLFRVGESFDFLIMFFSGLAGTVILIQDFISPQSLFRNNFQFLYLLPSNIILAFNMYFHFITERVHRIYWRTATFIIPAYIIFAWISLREIPFTDIFMASPIFIRSAFYAFIGYIKKSQTSLNNEVWHKNDKIKNG